MANGPEPELAKHAPRTSGHTSLKQEHQSTSIYTQESESLSAGLKTKAKHPSNCVFLSISLSSTAEIVPHCFFMFFIRTKKGGQKQKKNYQSNINGFVRRKKIPKKLPRQITYLLIFSSS